MWRQAETATTFVEQMSAIPFVLSSKRASNLAYSSRSVGFSSEARASAAYDVASKEQPQKIVTWNANRGPTMRKRPQNLASAIYGIIEFWKEAPKGGPPKK
jgi:hypothetical protein